MTHEYYNQKLNDVIVKCPIEAGVEILAYNLLDYVLISEKLSLVDTNSIWKKKDDRLVFGSVPDMAILSQDFEFGTQKGTVYGIAEVKAPNIMLPAPGTKSTISQKTSQIQKFIEAQVPFLYTNGLVWQYYSKDYTWEIVLARRNEMEIRSTDNLEKVAIDKKEFSNLLTNLREINWLNSSASTVDY